MDSNIILVDVDGVLLSWEYAFDVYMQENGHKKQDGFQFKYSIGKRYGIDEDIGKKMIKTFNESAAIGFLPPLRDAIHYVKKLHEEHGYIFHVITSLSLDRNAQKLRRMNLEKLFGETVFEEIIFLDTGADKTEALTAYKDSGHWFIEDMYKNAEIGQSLGLRCLLMEHGHSLDYKGNIKPVKNWKEVYENIIGI